MEQQWILEARRRPRGRRGLKQVHGCAEALPDGRRPRGRRGLKQAAGEESCGLVGSPPSRAAWIEAAAAEAGGSPPAAVDIDGARVGVSAGGGERLTGLPISIFPPPHNLGPPRLRPYNLEFLS